MAIFNSYVTNYQRVHWNFALSILVTTSRHSPSEPSAPSTARQLHVLSVEGAAPAGPFLGSGSVEGGLQTTARQPPVAVGFWIFKRGESPMGKMGKMGKNQIQILEFWKNGGKRENRYIFKIQSWNWGSLAFSRYVLQMTVLWVFPSILGDPKMTENTRFMFFVFFRECAVSNFVAMNGVNCDRLRLRIMGIFIRLWFSWPSMRDSGIKGLMQFVGLFFACFTIWWKLVKKWNMHKESQKCTKKKFPQVLVKLADGPWILQFWRTLKLQERPLRTAHLQCKPPADCPSKERLPDCNRHSGLGCPLSASVWAQQYPL